MQGRGCGPEQVASAVFELAHAAPKRFAAAAVIVGTQIEPGNKVSGRGPLGPIPAYFAEQWQRILLQARNLILMRIQRNTSDPVEAR
jgi:hypothetical protein